jgi:hypothetical protein
MICGSDGGVGPPRRPAGGGGDTELLLRGDGGDGSKYHD